jgi:hypothetical protein
MHASKEEKYDIHIDVPAVPTAASIPWPLGLPSQGVASVCMCMVKEKKGLRRSNGQMRNRSKRSVAKDCGLLLLQALAALTRLHASPMPRPWQAPSPARLACLRTSASADALGLIFLGLALAARAAASLRFCFLFRLPIGWALAADSAAGFSSCVGMVRPVCLMRVGGGAMMRIVLVCLGIHPAFPSINDTLVLVFVVLGRQRDVHTCLVCLGVCPKGTILLPIQLSSSPLPRPKLPARKKIRLFKHP